MAQQIILRRGTSSEWTASGTVVLAAAEVGVETDTGKFKIGNGVAAWTALGYAVGDIPTDVSDLTDTTSLIPIDISDLTDTTSLIPTSISDLDDVAITGVPGTNDILRWDGTDWISDTETVRFDTITLPPILPGDPPISFSARDDAKAILFSSLSGNIQFVGDALTNTVNIDVKTGPEFGGPVSAGGAAKQGTFYGATLQNDTADITIQPGGDLTPNGRVNIGSVVSGKDGSVMITRNTYSTVFGQGFWFNQHHETADAVNFNFLRTRGTGQTPTAVTAGDDVADVLFWARGAVANQAVAGIQVGVTGAPAAGRIPAKIEFLTDNGTNYGIRCEITDVVKTNSISAYTTDTDLTLTGSGTGVVRLSAGSTVGGVSIGTLTFAGTTANSTTRAALTPSSGQVYIQLDNLHGYLWDGTAWVDLDVLQGPAGTDGAAGADGVDGVDGTNGADGRTVLNGAVDPTIEGANGDFYINTVSNEIFGPKAVGIWPAGISLIGPAGADGADGTNGVDGTDGTNGVGVPVGGTIGQVLIKSSINDYDTAWGTASTVAAINDLTDVVISGVPSTGQVLKYDGTNWVNGTDLTSTIFTRQTVSGSTGSLANGATGPINITGFKSYTLLKIQTSAAAWVRIYVSEAARIADATRAEGEDPLPGAGIITEVITTGAETVLITPGAIGFNNESPVTTNIPVRVTNKSGNPADITVTLTAIQLEA